MTNDLGIEDIRQVGMRLVCGLVILLAAITAGLVATIALPGKWPAAVLGLGLSLYPAIIVLQRRTDGSARMTVCITIAAMPALMLFASEGLAWQTDLHMLFFALLAAASILCDWKALAAATVVVAVHHLGFGMIMPQWVFAGEGSFGRIVLHAVILLVEAATLIWVAQRIVALVESNERQANERLGASEALAAERAAQAASSAAVTAELGRGLTKLAGGDLTDVIKVDFPEAYAVLKRDYNSAVSGLRTVIVAVTETADGIRTGSEEIAQASEDLARRTESTAASLEEASAALVQIEDRLKATATASVETVTRADRAIISVGAGRYTAGGAREAMVRVSQSAKGIDSVIEGVDKIAFQTRVLAMNAAVEAGRAGDAGRGFAVVADLVSALALRAEEEAKRARDQLTVTQGEIVVAVGAVENVDKAFVDITDDVGAVHSLLASISRDNQAQSGAISEISAAVRTMDRSTQQNAAMVEQTSAAARSLAHEVDALTSRTSAFTVDAKPTVIAAPRMQMVGGRRR
jgi:methyl-accepting chemotaxis protein